jgi:hypothetical protein
MEQEKMEQSIDLYKKIIPLIRVADRLHGWQLSRVSESIPGGAAALGTLRCGVADLIGETAAAIAAGQRYVQANTIRGQS